MKETIPQHVSLKLSDLYRTLSQELAEHGELLLLLEEAQEAILVRSAARLWESVKTINSHLPRLNALREHREDLRVELAAALGQPGYASLRHLVALLPDSLQSHLISRVNEINDRVSSSQRCLRRNQLLLLRALEQMNSAATFLSGSETGRPDLEPEEVFETAGREIGVTDSRYGG